MKIDIISDLHIDHWDNGYLSKNPSCKTLHKPFTPDNVEGSILVVAGDVSDDFEMSIGYLNGLAKDYDKVLFIDGNHEHTENYPFIKSRNGINNIIAEIADDKLIYLGSNTHVIDGTAFIGINGWWDYRKMNKNVIENCKKNYFKKWMPHLLGKNSERFIQNLGIISITQSYELRNKILVCDQDEEIKQIIIVTHSVPLPKFCTESVIDTELNTYFENLVDLSPKIKYWIFGHTHKKCSEEINGVRFISNPRGRPDDYHREDYETLTISV